jgi:hypothetical protein
MDRPICQKCRQVVNRKRDGSVVKVSQCAHGAAKAYQSNVPAIKCDGCTLRQPLAQVGMACKEHPPSDPTWPEPHYSAGGVIVYSAKDGVPAPPEPEGYKRKAEEGTYSWWFEPQWPSCPYRQMMNKRTPKGDLQINVYCGSQGNRQVSFPQCQHCVAEVTKLGGTLDEETVLENTPLPEQMKEAGEDGVPDFPGAAQLVSNYWKAVKRWIAAGRPTRSAEEVKTIHADFCSTCNWYDEESQRCKGCGCSVKPKGIAILNKIEMATEHCPQMFW